MPNATTKQLVGRIGKEIRVNSNRAGTATAINFSLAESHYAGKDDSGQSVEETVWWECTYWVTSERQVAYYEDVLQVGALVTLSWRKAHAEVYENNDGEWIPKLCLRVEDIHSVAPPRDRGGEDRGSSRGGQQSQRGGNQGRQQQGRGNPQQRGGQHSRGGSNQGRGGSTRPPQKASPRVGDDYNPDTAYDVDDIPF